MKLIEDELFMDLCRYHIGDQREPDLEDRIRSQLWDKLCRAADHERYTKSLTDRKDTTP